MCPIVSLQSGAEPGADPQAPLQLGYCALGCQWVVNAREARGGGAPADSLGSGWGVQPPEPTQDGDFQGVVEGSSLWTLGRPGAPGPQRQDRVPGGEGPTRRGPPQPCFAPMKAMRLAPHPLLITPWLCDATFQEQASHLAGRPWSGGLLAPRRRCSGSTWCSSDFATPHGACHRPHPRTMATGEHWGCPQTRRRRGWGRQFGGGRPGGGSSIRVQTVALSVICRRPHLLQGTLHGGLQLR